MTRPAIVFLFNLLQDVNILRPLVFLAARDCDADIVLLVSHTFTSRDRTFLWQRELARLAVDVDAATHVFETSLDVHAVLEGRRGLLFAGSESDLFGHHETHSAMQVAPSGFLKVTLQHGYECVGFLQNREHVLSHGRTVTFAADVICGWSAPHRLTALVASQRPKLYVTGPTAVLNRPRPGAVPPPVVGGIVCENLHSVRFRAAGAFGPPFMATFNAFCATLASAGQGVTLRPHPGGQYVIKNKVALPPNVTLNNLPIYDVDLRAYAYGISAPSTVVLDMVFAGIPTAVWRDEAGVMDTTNYEGLTPISRLADWLAFVRDAVIRPGALLERQRAFVSACGIVTDPAEVHRRFARLMACGVDGPSVGAVRAGPRDDAPASFRPPSLQAAARDADGRGAPTP